MTVAIDTNILVELWSGTLANVAQTRDSLERLSDQDTLVISAPVSAELIPAPGHDPVGVEVFLRRAGIVVAWQWPEAVWRTAALAYRGYAERRWAQPGGTGPRRILTDCIIGARAVHTASALLTLDQGIYRGALPGFTVLVPGQF